MTDLSRLEAELAREVSAAPDLAALEAVRVFSYMEEFRLQAQKDEEVCVEGNLEEVVSSKGKFHQITLTYCPRYYEQVLKVAGLNQDSTM